tara:strand:- start:8423 stop:9277 length:855 start_codon:yes stop_codon:yes gene_type:complete
VTTWRDVKPGRPCEICGKPDWCGYTEDGAHRCKRVIAKTGYRVVRPADDPREPGNATVFRREEDVPGGSFVPRKISPPAKEFKLSNFNNVQAEYLANGMDMHEERDRLAKRLGLKGRHLFMLGIGWHKGLEAWTFPMYDETLKVVGIRTRSKAGEKRAVRGSSDGLFATLNPISKLPGPVYIAEGPTDTAALLALGLYKVLGRSNCLGGVTIIEKLCVNQDVVVVADHDPPGQNGAKHLIDRLQGISNTAKVIVPPAKDIREWVKQGATPDDFQSLLREEPLYA